MCDFGKYDFANPILIFLLFAKQSNFTDYLHTVQESPQQKGIYELRTRIVYKNRIFHYQVSKGPSHDTRYSQLPATAAG